MQRDIAGVTVWWQRVHFTAEPTTDPALGVGALGVPGGAVGAGPPGRLNRRFGADTAFFFIGASTSVGGTRGTGTGCTGARNSARSAAPFWDSRKS